MAKQTLRQKIATGIAAAGISLAAICGGCEDPQGNMALAALGNMAQVSPYASANDRTLGAGLGTIGQMGHEMNTAQAGKSQINVNVNNASQPTASDSSMDYITDLEIDGGIYTGQLLMPTGVGKGIARPHGKGKYVFADGRKYEGEFKDGKMHGHGVFTCAGHRYEGEFKDSYKNGYGAYTFPSGERHDGEWKDDLPNGQGVHTWPDGRNYSGDFRDGKMHGFGKMIYADGRTEEGAWRDDKFVGSQSQVSAGDNQKSQASSSKFGFVNVTADDPTFEVFADGAFVGNSPAKLKLSEGLHTIEVRKEGFKDYKKEIRVTDGSELNLRAVLEKK